MDAVEFINEKFRMCELLNYECRKCKIDALEHGHEGCWGAIRNHPEEAVEIVERWAKEHPRKTRQSEFLKMFPNAQIFKEILTINPCAIDSSRFCTEECHAYDDNNAGCFACRKKYWLEEVEDDGN